MAFSHIGFLFFLCTIFSLQNDIDARLSAYLKTELHRIYDREKTWRERLWRNGITTSSLMMSRKRPEDVGAEEVYKMFEILVDFS